jgi:LacI family transcriptional regulator
MSSQKKPTLSEVARLAKTSSATVDRVLNNRCGVSKKLENRVLNAAKLLMLDRNLERITKPLLRFSVLMNRPDKDIYARAQKAILDHQKKHPSKQFVCNFHFFSSQDPQDIVARIQTVEHGFDGAIIVAYDHPLVKDALRVLGRKIPVVTLLSDIPYSNRIHFAGSGNRIAGKLAGDMMGRLVKKEVGNILIISRLQHYTAHGDREVGFRQVISHRYPQLSGNRVVECNHGDERGLEVIQAALKGHAPLAGLYNISSWNISLIPLMKERGLLDNTVIISHGVNRRSRELLQHNGIDMIVEYCPESYAALAIDALLNHYGRCHSFSANHHHRLEIFTTEYLPHQLD